MRTVRRSWWFLPVAAVTLVCLSGCSLMSAAVVARRQHLKTLPSRRPGTTLCEESPGGKFTLKPRGAASVTGKFLGLVWDDTLEAGAVPCSTAIVLLRVGWQDNRIPLREVQWIQDPQSKAPVPIAFAAGLVVDFAIIAIICSGFDGLGN
jgi:hypothetical protein